MRRIIVNVDADDESIHDALRDMALVSTHQSAALTPLAGGVSSAIYRADLPSGVVCVKRALSRLKVAAEWHAPVERSRYEAEWMRVAGALAPGAVPRLLGEAPMQRAFAMEYLPPERYPVWKSALRDGRATAAEAAAVGRVLGRIHAGTADRPDIAARFPTDAIFEAIRIEPYLLATASVHADLSARLHELAASVRRERRVLVHGDFSPKNILLGPDGPVVLDAECAWFGEPAFDLAFVLNHLMLKAMWQPVFISLYKESFFALVGAYFPMVKWEPAGEVERRTAALLPGLLLARVDGKSPVEYVTGAAERDRIRRFAREQLVQPAASLRALADAWFDARSAT
jgi:aminoglycoside phosphotransferase (APT) family kinase protein